MSVSSVRSLSQSNASAPGFCRSAQASGIWTRTLAGLRSRWAIPCEWRKATPATICLTKDLICAGDTSAILRRLIISLKFVLWRSASVWRLA